MKERIFEIIEAGNDKDNYCKFYDFFMMIVITMSIIPLWFHKNTTFFCVIDKITVVIFIIDYLLRLMTADLKLKRGKKSYFLYPLTPMAIIDLISILPSMSLIQKGFRLLKVFRLIRTFKVFRIFRTFRYSKNITMLMNVFRKQKDSLITVCILAAAYVIFSALVIFNVEPDTFPIMFDALYWAAVSLTTVGYGDIYATSTIGKIITMISSFLGVAVVALPAGIIIAGYQEELKENQEDRED